MRRIRIDPYAVSTAFEGWGTSLAWWADDLGRLPAEQREPALRRLFSLEDGGLGLTVVRFNAGGGEDPEHPDSMMRRARMEGYRPRREAPLDPTADPGQRAVLRDAARIAADEGRELVVEVFGNSPPWWATRSGTVTGRSEVHDDAAPNLARGFELDYLRYLFDVAGFVERDCGVRVASVSPFNEPVSPWWEEGGRQEGCAFTHAGMRRLLAAADSLAPRALGDRLLAAPETWSIDEAVSVWDALGSAARPRIGRLNTHSYAGEHRSALRARAYAAGVGLWVSEYGAGDASGRALALEIVRDLRELAPSAWVLWQAVSPDDWGLLRSGARGAIIAENPAFETFARFSRSIRPGMRLAGTDDPRSIAALGEGVLAVVVVGGDEPERVELDPGAFAVDERDLALLRPEVPARGAVAVTLRGTCREDPGGFLGSGSWRLLDERGRALGDAWGAESWRAEACGDGSVRLVDETSGRELGVVFASRREGARLRRCPAGRVELAKRRSRFDVAEAGDGTVVLRNRGSGLTVARRGDGAIVQTAAGAACARWRLERVRPAARQAPGGAEATAPALR